MSIHKIIFAFQSANIAFRQHLVNIDSDIDGIMQAHSGLNDKPLFYCKFI